MKKIISALLVTALLFSAMLPTFEIFATEGNPTSFTADFTTTDVWTGMTGAVNIASGWFGAEKGFNDCTSGWENAKGTVTTVQAFDFGSVFDMQFSLYTYYANGNKNNVHEDFYVAVGGFSLAICDFQTRLKLSFNDQEIPGTLTAKADIAYPAGGIRDYDYTVHIEPGNIVIESDLLKFTADFSDFESVDNAAVSLTINETWQISKEHFYNLSAAADLRTAEIGDVNADGERNAADLTALRQYLLGVEGNLVWRFGDLNGDSKRDIRDLVNLKKLLARTDNASFFIADFTTTDGWNGMTDAINTADGWFGSKNKFNGCTNGWDNPKGSIYTNARFDFGNALTAEFSLYTRFPNSNPVTDSMDVLIGDFTISISAYQNQISLLYGDETIASVWNEIYNYDSDAKTKYNYQVYLAPGAIQIVQYNDTVPLLILDSDFADFAPMNNVRIGLTDNETWQIHEAHFGALSVTAVEPNPNAFTADFSSAEYWSGSRTDLINTVPMWFGTQRGVFGNTNDWENAKGEITAKTAVDLGFAFHAEFQVFTQYRNSAAGSEFEAYAVNIGAFRFVVLGHQDGLKVTYNGTDLGGTVVPNKTLSGAKTCTYQVDVKPGSVTVVSDAFTYTADFSDYSAVNNAAITLEVCETWHLGSGHITDFTVEKEEASYHTAAIESGTVGGTVTLDKTVANAGDTVIVTVSPAEGYMLSANGLAYREIDSQTEVSILTAADDSGSKFSFIMPDYDIVITAAFVETAETELSVSAVSYQVNCSDTAAADGIVVTTRLASAAMKTGSVQHQGKTYQITDFGLLKAAADSVGGELLPDTADCEVLSAIDGVELQTESYMDYLTAFQAESWSQSYAIRPYVTLTDAADNSVSAFGETTEISMNQASGLVPEYSVTASYVVNNGEKYYIIHNGQPYLTSGVQAQLNRYILSVQPDTQTEFDTYLRPMFAAAAELEYDTLVYMMPWRGFELKKDQYNFELIRMLYACADEYDLNIQLVWGGSDVCGGYWTWVPDYIRSDTSTYSLYGDTEAINYADPDLIWREKKAFSALLEALYRYDTACRTVCIQLENEPNAGIDGVPDSTSAAEVEEKTWVGQAEAVKSLINELAILAHTGAYHCVTRVNYVAYNCYFNGIHNSDPIDLLYSTAVDMVGFSNYGNLNYDIRALQNLRVSGNVPHVAESSGSSPQAAAKMIYAATNGGGLLQYELFYITGYSGNSCVLKPDGSYRDGSDGDNITTELISINKMLASLGSCMATLPYENMTAFNLAQSPECNEQAVIVGAEINYTCVSSESLGGVGMAICADDGVYYLYHSRGEAVYRISGKTVLSASIGCYENGIWVEKRAVDAADTIVFTASDALNGYVCRMITE